MKPFLLLATLLVASTCSASLHGVISTQYQTLDPHSHTYSYGYADPNSQKHESRSHDGVTRGSYSYVDANGHVQSVSYTADPHSGFNAVGTNLPKAPADPHPQYAAAHSYVPLAYSHAAPALHYVALTHAGVPVDTPEVQHAKAQHAAAHAAAAHAAAASPDHHHLYKRSLYAGPWAYQHAAHAVQLTHGGVPVDEPDVQAAKAEHYAAHAKALGQVAHAHGAPIETPEVQHAKAAHFAAHAAARSGHSISIAPINHHGYHIPVIHNGVPVETPEVQQAKAKHFAAVAEASAHAGSSHGDDGSYDGRWDNKWEGNKWENKWENKWDEGRWDGHQQQHKGPIHIPVIHNGVPVEPAEVQHARAAHLSAVAAASHNAGHGGWNGAHNDGDDGQYRPSYNHY